jgi:hypothetical protein
MTQGRNIDAGEEPTQEEDNITDSPASIGYLTYADGKLTVHVGTPADHTSTVVADLAEFHALAESARWSDNVPIWGARYKALSAGQKAIIAATANHNA